MLENCAPSGVLIEFGGCAVRTSRHLCFSSSIGTAWLFTKVTNLISMRNTREPQIPRLNPNALETISVPDSNPDSHLQMLPLLTLESLRSHRQFNVHTLSPRSPALLRNDTTQLCFRSPAPSPRRKSSFSHGG